MICLVLDGLGVHLGEDRDVEAENFLTGVGGKCKPHLRIVEVLGYILSQCPRGCLSDM